MYRFFLLLLISCSYSGVFAQKQLCIAFYNQENLFDTIDDPHKNDNEFLPGSRNDWNTEKYFNKLNHMSAVIASMNGGQSPDVLGMCEVENRAVLIDLVNREALVKAQYEVVHVEGPDERSIDNALLFKKNVFRWVATTSYPVTIDTNPHFKTRAILVVKLEAKNKSPLIFIVNHFPSRLGGQEQSEYKRFVAASVLRRIFDSLMVVEPNTGVIAMGDFNDEPTDKSIDSVLNAKGDSTAILYNPMWLLQASGQGSLVYRKDWDMLDQFILNLPLRNGKSKFRYLPGSAAIHKLDWMLETDEKFKGNPKRTFAGSKYLNGYSDHLPVFLLLRSN